MVYRQELFIIRLLNVDLYKLSVMIS